MKTYQIIILVSICFALLTGTGCKEYTQLVPELQGIPSGGVVNTEQENLNGDALSFYVDLFAVNPYGGFLENLNEGHFSIEINNGQGNVSIVNTGIDYIQDQAKDPYSACLLIDQSGSIADTDPQNARIEAGKEFINIMGENDEVALVEFSGSSYHVIEGFSQDKSLLKNGVESLRGTHGGGTPLFESIYDMLTYTDANAGNNNKAIIVFTDGKDTGLGIIDDIIELANAKNIQVYTIGLGNGVNNSDLTKIAAYTGGAVMWANDALQLISLYSSLGQLLDGSAFFYRTQWLATVNGTQWFPGDIIEATIIVTLPDGSQIRYPVYLVVQ